MKNSSSIALIPYEVNDAADLIAGKVRIARIARGWTQADLALRSDLSTRTITNIESGAIAVQLGFVLKVLWCLDLIGDYAEAIKKVGLNDNEFAMLEQTLPKRVRTKRVIQHEAIISSTTLLRP
jgi:transcriptional regulator with XRE-family HTH domain